MQIWKYPLYFVRLMVCARDKSYFDIHARCFTHNLQRFISSLPVFCDQKPRQQAENDFIFRSALIDSLLGVFGTTLNILIQSYFPIQTLIWSFEENVSR